MIAPAWEAPRRSIRALLLPRTFRACRRGGMGSAPSAVLVKFAHPVGKEVGEPSETASGARAGVALGNGRAAASCAGARSSAPASCVSQGVVPLFNAIVSNTLAPRPSDARRRPGLIRGTRPAHHPPGDPVQSERSIVGEFSVAPRGWRHERTLAWLSRVACRECAPSVQHLVAGARSSSNSTCAMGHRTLDRPPNVVPPSRAEGEAIGMPNQPEPGASWGSGRAMHECALIHRLSVAPTHIAMTARPAADPDVQPTRVPLITCGAGEAGSGIFAALPHTA